MHGERIKKKKRIHITKTPVHYKTHTHTSTHYKTSQNDHSTRYTPNEIVKIQSSTLNRRSL